MTVLLLVLLAVAAIVLFRLFEQNKDLEQSVLEMKRKLSIPAKLSPFGLEALERVGKALGGLSQEVVRVAYAAAAVCEKQNTVASDVVNAREQQADEIDGTENNIRIFEAQLGAAKRQLSEQKARADEIDQIGDLLPS